MTPTTSADAQFEAALEARLEMVRGMRINGDPLPLCEGYARWARQHTLESEPVKALRDALVFYADELKYDYNHTQGMNYIWNDLGRTAREALAALERAKGGK